MNRARWGLVVAPFLASFAAVAIAACLDDAPPLSSVDDGGSTVTDAALVDAPPTDAGADAFTGDAGNLPPPRPKAPLSTATVTTQTPTLKWALASVSTEVLVEICKERACTTVEHVVATSGASVKAPPLTPGVHFWRVRSRKGTAISTIASPTWEMFVPYANGNAAQRDLSWGTVADFDGDGIAELVVGGQASVKVIPGVAPGTARGAPSTVPAPPLSDGGIEYFHKVASAGDFDGDGYADLMVGSYRPDAPSSGDGHVYVYRGGPGGIPANATPSFSIAAPPSTTTSTNHFATALAGVGDVDGDGYGDIAVGAELLTTTLDSGAVTYGTLIVYYGGPVTAAPVAPRMTKLGDGSGNNYYFGSHVGAAGDVNGDGYADIVASGRDTPNVNFVFYGGPNGPELVAGRVTVFDVPAAASSTDAYSGTNELSPTPGDLNGDGLSDVVIGDFVGPWSGNTAGRGRVFVYNGTPSGAASAPSAELHAADVDAGESRGFGFSLALAGDNNGDGYDDLIVGSAVSPGTVYWLSGGANGPSDSRRVTIPSPGGFTPSSGFEWGFVVAGIGDFDDDGVSDVAVAPPQGEKIYVYPGAKGPADAGIAPSRVLTPFQLGAFLYGPTLAYHPARRRQQGAASLGFD